VLLLLLAAFAIPGLAAASRPLVLFLGGESALHYPQLYLHMPNMPGRAEFVITLTIAAIAHGAAVLRFAGNFRRRREARAWRESLRRAPALILLALIGMAAEWLIGQGLTRIEGAVPRPALLGALVAGQIVVRALIYLAIAGCLLRGLSPWGALRLAARVARRNGETTAILVGAPTLLLDLVNILFERWDPLNSGLLPETMLAALSTQILLQMVFGFVLIGSTTRFFLARVER